MAFESLFALEDELSEYTGAPYVVLTDGCTHALELVFRYYRVQDVEFTAFTYISIVQLAMDLGLRYQLTDETWTGEYQFHGTNIWDSARRLQPAMYRSGQVQCLSFGNGKPISAGKCGAILLDDVAAYHRLSLMRSDGRDLRISPWIEQKAFPQGWHYCPTLETVGMVREKLRSVPAQCQSAQYPDCRHVKFVA